MRDYHFADQDSVTWRVWGMERPTALCRVRLDADERLLDARRDVVLLRRTDERLGPRPSPRGWFPIVAGRRVEFG